EELRTRSKLSHDNVLPLRGAGLHEGVPFMVTLFMSGGTVNQYLSKKVMGPVHLLNSILYLIHLGLSALHRQGVFHGDLRGAKIRINESGTAAVSDLLCREVPSVSFKGR
ncbi:kinase-like domain-containing protein, partial [Blyttiomyces helicus]